MLVFDDEFDVKLRIESLGRTSVVHVTADGRPVPLPEWLREGVEGEEV
jgi:acyl-CoA thioesterase FadM